MMWLIKDRPGCISVASMRTYFERSIAETPALSQAAPLDIVAVNGDFDYYAEPETNRMWFGFALGMRAAERIAGQFTTLPDPQDAVKWREQHDRDSAELRRLCQARDDLKKERDLLRLEIAGLTSSVGHLARLVDDLQPSADRYHYLRERPLDAIERGGIFAGKVPENLVLNGEDLDREIDAARAQAKTGRAL